MYVTCIIVCINTFKDFICIHIYNYTYIHLAPAYLYICIFIIYTYNNIIYTHTRFIYTYEHTYMSTCNEDLNTNVGWITYTSNSSKVSLMCVFYVILFHYIFLYLRILLIPLIKRADQNS